MILPRQSKVMGRQDLESGFSSIACPAGRGDVDNLEKFRFPITSRFEVRFCALFSAFGKITNRFIIPQLYYLKRFMKMPPS
jgi:hypothetical protein